MSFIGQPKRRTIRTRDGKQYAIIMLQKSKRQWVAVVIYARNGDIKTKDLAGNSDADAYYAAVEWVLNNIDPQAIITAL
jgi:hypothetical protein